MLLGNKEKVTLEMKNNKKLPWRRTNTFFFIVPYLLKMFFKTKIRFGSPGEMWILKLFWRHQFFEAMVILKVPGLRNIIFENLYVFGKIIFNHISEQIFSWQDLPDKIFSGQICSWPGAVSFFSGGSGPKNYSSDLPPDFQKLFWSRNRSPWELWSCTAPSFSGNFKPRPILSTNRA